MSSPLALRALAVECGAAIHAALHVRIEEVVLRINALETQLPDALDFLARSMRAGHAFSISLEMVGEEIHDPLGPEFRALFNEQNLGASLERAFALAYPQSADFRRAVLFAPPLFCSARRAAT